MDNEEISKITMWAMIAVALFFDGLQFGADLMNFIPFAGFILAWVITSGISIFAFLTFFLWFQLQGIKFNSKIVATTVGAFFIELIPVLNALPAWTLSVVVTLLFFQSKEILDKVAPGIGKIIDKDAKSNTTVTHKDLTKFKR